MPPRCGLFDVSHMGEIELRGPGAAALCQRLTVNDVGRLRDRRRAVLGALQRAGRRDRRLVIVYRLARDRYLLVVNAANTATGPRVDTARTRANDVEVDDQSATTGLLALQGPEAEVGAADADGGVDSAAMRPFTVRLGDRGGDRRAPVADRLHRRGRLRAVRAGGEARPSCGTRCSRRSGSRDGVPAGLAARDTLRLEAGLPLCGTDMDDEHDASRGRTRRGS